MRSVRIGAGQGFYGDTPEGAVDVLLHGDVQYIACDALAELTMAILQRDRMKDPTRGFTRDLPAFAAALLPEARRRNVRIITNAGGMNPVGAAAAVRRVAAKLGLDGLKIGVVSGDDLTASLDGLGALDHLYTGAPLDDATRARVVFAVAYLGARPIVDALAAGADVVVTGRVADASLFLAPMIHELGWRDDDWDRLAAGVVLGHLMECSGQSTGGNFSGDFWNVDLDRVGYPVCEMFEDGTAVLGKPAGTGGRVSFDTVKEQLLYEVLDPRAYASPDVVADFTSVRLDDLGDDRVRVSGVRGRPRPDRLKAILGYLDGWTSSVNVVYAWPHAVKKAKAAADIVLRAAARAGVTPTEHLVELVGVDSAHGDASPAIEPNEVTLRLAARFESEDAASRFPRIGTTLALNGPPFIAGGLVPQPARPLLGVWPTTVARDAAPPRVEIE